MKRYSNFALFFILLGAFFLFKPYQNLSTNLLALLPQNEQTTMLKLYENSPLSREIFVSVQGEDFKAIKDLEKKVLATGVVSLKKTPLSSEAFFQYLKKYRFYLKAFNSQNLLHVKTNLEEKYQNLLTNPLYTTIDKDDPLSLFTSQKIAKNIELKNGHLFLKNYGYMSIFTFDKTVNFQNIYDVFTPFMNEKNKIFSPAFYFVQNAKAIQSQVNFLIFLALGILLFLYLVILRDISLLGNTLSTLVSAMIFASLIVSALWDYVSLFVFVFGISISTVAIDYMFHHYFLGFYEKQKGFNKAVFFGFLSTFFAFFLFLFVDFPFIRQLSLFSLLSLTYSYVIFAFVFPKIGFEQKRFSFDFPQIALVKNYKYFSLALLLALGWLIGNLHLDFNIKNLDYHNEKLQTVELFFKEKLQEKNSAPFLLKARSLDELITKSRELKALHVTAPLAYLLDVQTYEKRKKLLRSTDFSLVREKINTFSKEIGYREGFFVKAYNNKLLEPAMPKYTLESLQDFGFDVFFDGKVYYTFVFAPKELTLKNASKVDSAKLFKTSLQKIDTQLLFCGLGVLLGILGLLLIVAKENFYKTFSYILLPCVFVLLFVHNSMNVLQIFMLFIIVALSIDYGIYLSKSSLPTKQAILFSVLSTFAGFGVLVFSSIGVLFYIGEVATLGLGALVILMLVGKDED